MEALYALLSVQPVETHPAITGIVALLSAAMILGGMLIDQTRLSGRAD